jgi:2-hydroxychromene-2-carboxylate isomerase
MKTVEFLFDFGSPNAYLSHLVIPAIEARTGVRFLYVPVLLGGIFKLTNNRSPVESLVGIKNKMEYQRLEIKRFIRKHAINSFVFNPHFPVNTLAMMRGAIAAEALGIATRYNNEMFHHMWGAPRNLNDPAVLRAAYEESGFDADALLTLAASPESKRKLAENTQRAVDRGAFGAPSFFVGDELYFGKDQLRDVEEEILA